MVFCRSPCQRAAPYQVRSACLKGCCTAGCGGMLAEGGHVNREQEASLAGLRIRRPAVISCQANLWPVCRQRLPVKKVTSRTDRNLEEVLDVVGYIGHAGYTQIYRLRSKAWPTATSRKCAELRFPTWTRGQLGLSGSLGGALARRHQRHS